LLGRIREADTDPAHITHADFKAMLEIVGVKQYAPSQVVPTQAVLTRDSIDMDPHGILMTVPGEKDHQDIVTEFFRRVDAVTYFAADAVEAALPYCDRSLVPLDTVKFQGTDSGGVRTSLRAVGMSPAKAAEEAKAKSMDGQKKAFDVFRDGIVATFLHDTLTLKEKYVDPEGVFKVPKEEKKETWLTMMVDDNKEQKEQIVSLKREVRKALNVDGNNISAEEYAEASAAWDAAKTSLQEEIDQLKKSVEAKEYTNTKLFKAWGERGKKMFKFQEDYNHNKGLYDRLQLRFAAVEAELETTKSFIGKSTQKKRQRVDPIPIVPMSAALVRTPPLQPTVPADPDSTEEYDFDSEGNVTPIIF
jgi:hypothetical protein